MASKQSNSEFIAARLRGLDESHLYRQMRSVSVNGSSATVNGRKVIHMCSNDYLGLAANPKVTKRASDSLDQVSQCSSRLIAGNSPRIAGLEKQLARHRRTRAALLFPTGYMANLGAVTALADRDSTILSDELNHASIIDACRLSGAAIKVFRHNDIPHLEEVAMQTEGRKIIITEGIFSMDGDLADLKGIRRVAREHDALTILDDAHGDFVVGPDYAGVPSLLGEHMDIHVSSLSKGLGCFGGYVACSRHAYELLVNTSRQFIYTSALPDHLCAAAEEAMKLAKIGDLQERLAANIRFLRQALLESGFRIGGSTSQIIPVMIGREDLAVKVSNQLLAEGVFAQAVRYPTVKRGSSRLRLSVTAAHTKSQLAKVIEAMQWVARSNKIIG